MMKEPTLMSVAPPFLSDQVLEHLAAAVQLSHRSIYLDLLDRAGSLIASDCPKTAVTLIWAVVETMRLFSGALLTDQEEEQLKTWRELRNRIVHDDGGANPVSTELAGEMLDGVRRLVNRCFETEQFRTPRGRPSPEVIARIRSKYKSFSATSEDFMREKHEDG